MPKNKKTVKTDKIEKTEGSQNIEAVLPYPTDSLSSTDINRIREATRGNLAKYVIFGLFGMLLLLSTGLFTLIYLNKSQSSIFKDILLSFIGFSSGLLVSILGFYYKEINNE